VTRIGTATFIGIAVLASLAGCAVTKPARAPPGVRPSVEVGPPLKSDAWKAVATPDDKDRLSRLGLAWQEALEEAGRTNAADIRREGKLLMPRSGLPRPEPTPGSYYCRLIKLGKATTRSKPFETFRPFFCYVEVEDDLLTNVRPAGYGRTMIQHGSCSSAAWALAMKPCRSLMAMIPSATWPECWSGLDPSNGGW
jgi:hypothetical protein